MFLEALGIESLGIESSYIVQQVGNQHNAEGQQHRSGL